MSSSPVSETVFSLIHIRRAQEQPLYLQIAEQLAQACQKGLLAPGVMLPGTRQLAELLKVHRKTVIAAYEELSSQGFVSMQANKGTFVHAEKSVGIISPFLHTAESKVASQTQLPIPHNRLLELTISENVRQWMLDDGLADGRLFQWEALGIGLHALLKSTDSDQTFFLNQLQMYFKETQALKVAANQMMMTPSRYFSIYITAQALLQKEDIVVVASPGNYRVNMILQQSGAQLQTIGVDENGLLLDELESVCRKKSIRMVYVNPTHHYPNGAALNWNRRMELLRLSDKYGFIVLEDDAEGLIDFQKRKLPNLISLAGNGQVVFIHSFEQVLPTDANVSAILATEKIIREIQKYASLLNLQKPSWGAKVVAFGLQSGGLQRLIKRMTRIYLQRRNLSAELLENEWGHKVKYTVPKSGLSFWLEFPWDFNLLKFAKQYAKKDIFLPQELLYQSRQWTAMQLGFGKWQEEEFRKIITEGTHFL